MTFDVRSAAILLQCARSGSLGRAAQALNMAQPAVTRALNRLEAQLGVPLFERTTRGVVPTAYGAGLLPHAELLVSESANAEDLVRQMRGARRGLVRVGGVGSVTGGLLVAALTEARRRSPGLQVLLTEDLEDKLLERLKSGEIDLAVSPEPYADDAIELATLEAFHDEVTVCARPGHPALDGPGVTLAAAAGFDWALPPAETPVSREWLRRFHSRGLDPRAPALISRSVQVIKAAAMADDLMCWMPEPLVRDELAEGKLCRVAIEGLDWSRAFRVYRRRKGIPTPGAALFLEALKDQGGRI